MTFCEIKSEEVIIKLYNPTLQFEDVKEIWINLLAKCPHSFFLSWGWKEVWLKSLPDASNISFVVGFKEKKPIFAFFIGSQTKIRRGVFRTHQISLNSTLSKSTSLTIEYNAILVDPKITLSLETLIQQMPIKNWDEFYLNRIASSYFPNFKINDNLQNKFIIQKEDLASHYIDLKKVRDADMNYLSLLSNNRRYKLRRSIEAYEKNGNVRIIAADTEDEALLMLEELKILHQKTWVGRGKPGSFARDFYCEFHKNLIANRFNKNEIQLLHAACGNDTIGYLYSFIYNGQVYNYQGGFNYLPKKVFIPGLTCHYLAVLYNATKGLDTYDFLAGDVEYKRSLSTDFAEMQNILIQKKKVKFAIENRLKHTYLSIRKLKDQFINNGK